MTVDIDNRGKLDSLGRRRCLNEIVSRRMRLRSQCWFRHINVVVLLTIHVNVAIFLACAIFATLVGLLIFGHFVQFRARTGINLVGELNHVIRRISDKLNAAKLRY
jgi:hypothetical protein